MTIDDYTLIADLFGKRRSEKRPSSSNTSTIMGVATSNSASGSVMVRINGDLTGGENGEFAIPTDVHIVEGDVVSISLVGGTAKAPRVVGTVGGGDRTFEYAYSAEQAANLAQSAASSAVSDAAEAKSAAQSAVSDASDAKSAAQSAVSDAAEAKGAAQSAVSDAAEAKSAAQSAVADAAEAKGAAQSAQSAASAANTAANSALTQLSIVEDVAGTLDWISKHGTYTATSDTTVQEGTVYFERQGNDYTPVIEPTGNPHSQGWYVLDVTDSQSDFIMAHLAVTSRGLWVLPSGVGSSTTPATGESQADSDARQASNYKVLLASDGMYLYDGSGNQVVKYGSSIQFASDRGFSIGDTSGTSYIAFVPGHGVVIGGGVTLGSNKTLSQLLAAYDTAALSVVIESSAGTGFRNQSGSTTLTARVYQYGDNELDSSGTSFAYKWYKNGTAVSGGTSKTLTVNAPSTTDTYKCEVTI